MEELLCVVDESDNFLKAEKRSSVHNSESWHRGVHVFLFNKNGDMLIQVRSPHKDKFPDRIEEAISEHVTVGESYEEAAVRGLFEELRIKTSLELILYFRCVYGLNDNMICNIFKSQYDNDIEPNEEISELKFITIGELREILEQDPNRLTPWFQEHLKWYFGLTHNLHIYNKY